MGRAVATPGGGTGPTIGWQRRHARSFLVTGPVEHQAQPDGPELGWCQGGLVAERTWVHLGRVVVGPQVSLTLGLVTE